jgi:dimethylargininase
MLQSEGNRLTRVVVCTPGQEYYHADEGSAHNIRAAADPALALAQHDQLKAVLAAAGCEVIDVPELPGHPNSVFTRDTAVCTPSGFVTLRMGLSSRRGEEAWMAAALAAAGEPCAGQILEPGTLEGGDVILAGNVAFVGLSTRTNNDGARQMSVLLEGMGYEVRLAAVPSAHLHLGGAMSLVGRRRIICCRGEFPDALFAGFDPIPVEHRDFAAGNVICLAENEVLADGSGDQENVLLLESSGVRVTRIDLSEFRKGAGGPSCLILPMARKADRSH